MKFLGVGSVLLLLTLFQVAMVALAHEKSKCPLAVPTLSDDATLMNRPYNKKIIIAHRGASFSLPEHTLESYRLALELGADYIEPDLVSTKDGTLIALHTLDLNITTNVAEIYPGRTSFSKHVNRTGYWAYDFDWKEIQLLKVKQRLGYTGARSTVYDGMFGIPSLEQILELLHHHNTDVLPLLNKNIKKRSGLYAELKYPEWLEKDADLNLVDLFLEELHHSDFTDSMWNDTECKTLKFDEYLVPPLVVQSFDGLILKEIKQKWKQHAAKRAQQKNQGDDGTTSAPPPMVLLVDSETCWLDEFWFNVGEWKTFLQGIGPDKACLMGEEARPLLNRAREHELAIHPWTVRGELEFIMEQTEPTVVGLNNLQEELFYWFCTVGVHGIFTENVDVAVMVASLPCPDDDSDLPGLTELHNSTTSSRKQLCYNTDREAQLFVGLAAGVMGIFVGSIFAFWLSQSRFCKSRRHRRRQLVVPTQEPVEVEMV